MAFAEDLSQFFNPGDFAESAVITGPNSFSLTVNGLFDDDTQSVQMYDGAAEETAAVFTGPGDAFPGVTRRMTLVISTRTFKIERLHRENGLMILSLSNA